MEQRFEARKREIEQDAKLDTKDLAGAAQRLDRFLAPYFDYLPRSETRQNASFFVQGLPHACPMAPANIAFASTRSPMVSCNCAK